MCKPLKGYQSYCMAVYHSPTRRRVKKAFSYIPLLALVSSCCFLIYNIYNNSTKSRNIIISFWSLFQTHQNITQGTIIVSFTILLLIKHLNLSILKKKYILKETIYYFHHTSLASSSALSLCRWDLLSQSWSVLLK